ncbi:MAG: hypothetical protein WDZ86_03410 [Gammaproteobacteria bacterium]
MITVKTKFSSVLLGAAGLLLLAGCANQPGAKPESQAQKREVRQEAGKIVYWVLPGPRKLDPAIFGTAENPRMLPEPKIKAAREMVAAGKMPPTVPDVLEELPILVGVPAMARMPDDKGDLWFNNPNPFSDKAEIIQGHFKATFTDVVKHNPPGKPHETPDKATMEAHFTDPSGNEYRAILKMVMKPPFPGYNTEGGVMLDSIHHGSTGIGSPLMPEVKTIAAFWGVGDIYINGKLAQPDRMMHLMTTEIVRDRKYQLVFQKDLPLAPERRHIRGQATHTHLVVLPLKASERGPVFSPLKTAFMLPNGMPQPFLHIMYEQDEVIDL